eukprot:gnl/TRDRNA2_/TRDRNA2_205031_c0_seq1.p1 gnl/TRDRNA2_/TRDRNA2_205031_c0~~gnl/TRDRNA2_/TRDRNA2_205031_c0_seq1.p1  ORF type:complete len:479 (-),score=67.37 gnl/TRDRNA2_/TRDRNA2_205031_c0_seq1:5-1441(-)
MAWTPLRRRMPASLSPSSAAGRCVLGSGGSDTVDVPYVLKMQHSRESRRPLCERKGDEVEMSSQQRKRWYLGCWNQHRIGSYLQQNCPWVTRLRAQGASRSEVDGALRALRVEYAASEVVCWTSACDVVALQEVDGHLRHALSAEASGCELVESRNHVDGRGVEVDCTNAVLLGPGVTVARREAAELRVALPGRRGPAARDHVALLLNHACRRRPLIVCSVHLHPPAMVEAGGSTYLEYLEPLQQALRSLLAPGVEDAAPCCALVGDFNLPPSEFASRTAVDPFWAAFSATSSSSGRTAHASNPCEDGDYGLFFSAGPDDVSSWWCEASGSSDFEPFEHYCDKVVAGATLRYSLERANEDLSRAGDNIRRALSGLETLGTLQKAHSRRPLPPPLQSSPGDASTIASSRRPPPPPPPNPARAAQEALLGGLLHGLEGLRTELGKCKDLGPCGHDAHAMVLRKGLLQSDHRPLIFREVDE